MTADDLKEAWGTEDGKAAIAEFLAGQGFKAEDEVQGLINKRDELLGKLNKAKTEKNAFHETLVKYGIADVEDLGGKLAKLEAADASLSDLEKLQRRIEIMERESAEAKESAKKANNLRMSAEKKAQITAAMKEAHVDDESFDVLYDHFDKIAKVADEDGNLTIVVETDDGQSPIKSFIGDWSKTDKAKRFVKAAANGGGGAHGPGAAGGSQMSLDDIEKIQDRTARMEALEKFGAVR